jgi:hypothetical protein
MSPDAIISEIEDLIADGYVSDDQRGQVLGVSEDLVTELGRWRAFAVGVARMTAPPGAEDHADHTDIDDLPALLDVVRLALTARDRAEATGVLVAALHAEVKAGVALASALRAEVEAGVALDVVRAEVAEVTLTTARAEGVSLRSQLDDALRRAREAEAALTAARAEGAAAERARILAIIRERAASLGAGCHVRQGWRKRRRGGREGRRVRGAGRHHRRHRDDAALAGPPRGGRMTAPPTIDDFANDIRAGLHSGIFDGYTERRDRDEALAALDALHARAEKAESNYAWMVERAASGANGGPGLDGYRALGAQALAATERAEAAEHNAATWRGFANSVAMALTGSDAIDDLIDVLRVTLDERSFLRSECECLRAERDALTAERNAAIARAEKAEAARVVSNHTPSLEAE